MPPKKDKDSKKKKDGPKVIIGPPPPELIDETTREFYLIQIRDLEERIEKYQKKCDELEVKNAEYQSKFNKMSEDKKDIVMFIKKKLDEKIDEIAEVNDHLIGLQQAKDAEKEMFEQQLQQLRTEYQETKDQLTSENMMLGGKLASLEEFKVQREDLFAKIKELENNLFLQEADHRDAKYSLEKKHVMDKDRSKKEMITKVSQVASEFRKVSNRQMSETTKRTIRENVSINAQLTKMSDKTIDLIQENDELKEKELRQHQQIEILEANEKELARKNVSNQKLIILLKDKCKKQEEQILLSYEDTQTKFEAIENERKRLRTQLDTVRDDLRRETQENEKLEMQRDWNSEMLHDKKVLKSKLQKLIVDCAEAVEEAVKPTTSEDCEDSPSDISAKRDMLMENLLLLLNSANEIKGSSAAAKSSAKTEPVDQLLPFYQPGHLGFVPHADHHVLTKMENFKLKQKDSNKRLPGKTIGTQTASSAKAMFLAEQLITQMPLKGLKLNPLMQTSDKSLPPLSRSQSSTFFPTGLVH